MKEFNVDLYRRFKYSTIISAEDEEDLTNKIMCVFIDSAEEFELEDEDFYVSVIDDDDSDEVVEDENNI